MIWPKDRAMWGHNPSVGQDSGTREGWQEVTLYDLLVSDPYAKNPTISNQSRVGSVDIILTN